MAHGKLRPPLCSLNWSHHDDALRQSRAGQEVDHAQPLGEPEVPEGRRLQGDSVRGGAGRRRRLPGPQWARLGWQ